MGSKPEAGDYRRVSPSVEVRGFDSRIANDRLGKLGRAALALIGKFPAQEVSSNLRRLKQIMETGTATDTSYAIPGKFVEL